ncbi:hypothetical protein CPJCM30710_18250 [Clostridium polyendosporum]|uniref:Superfamily II DNA/RNA helicase required for DNA uptake (Late competence protein) n=1 Tax=Clostridium polyendosporum TaxID=69208 RepID=A0A919VEH2_9CLOT|nr:hypothetical protein [Clostridium polyendosporum]GIM29159.1 hypothetical protein CPJCM30710_18250 [Clostridium polyendosporum]
MVNIEMDKICLEFNYAVNEINRWYEKEDCKIFNIITIPYNTSRIFRELITLLVSSEKKVLYISNDEKANEDLIKYLRNVLGFKIYSILRNGKRSSENFLHFTTFDNIRFINDNYELIIYDDISAFSKQTKLEIQNSLDYLYKKTRKLLVYSIERIFNNCPILEIGNCCICRPFVEPRIITTRVNLNQDIPYLLYDYLKWFRKNNRKVIIHTPDKEKSESIYAYFNDVLNIASSIKLILFSNDDKKRINELLAIKDKPVMVITDIMGEVFEEIDDIDIIVYFADHKIFDYKKFIYMCGKVGKNKGLPGEVLLFSNEISQNMEMAKDLARVFNKFSWEKGLLR